MWWQYVIIVGVLIFGVYGFITLTGFETRLLSRRTDRTAESMYGNYADSAPKQRRSARKRDSQQEDHRDKPASPP
jgi:hypothetical protein